MTLPYRTSVWMTVLMAPYTPPHNEENEPSDLWSWDLSDEPPKAALGEPSDHPPLDKVLYEPRGKWAWTAGQPLRRTRVLRTYSGQCRLILEAAID